MSHHNSSNASRLKIARHPQVIHEYRIMRGSEVLIDNLQSLDEALLWQSKWAWYDEIVSILEAAVDCGIPDHI